MNKIKNQETNSRLIMLEHGSDSSLGDAFVFITKNNKVILIDTGSTGSALLIEEEVMQYGGEVEACIITHQHDDHADGLISLLERGNINIKSLYWAPLDIQFIEKYDPECLERAVALNEAINKHNLKSQSVKTGDILMFDNCRIDILAGGKEYEVNPINNSSLIFTIHDGERKFLFTGDAGEEEGRDLMKQKVDLKCEILKVAHHGQAGLPLEFYNLTQAGIALFSTAQWLWDWPTTQETVKHLSNLGMEIYSIHSHGRVVL